MPRLIAMTVLILLAVLLIETPRAASTGLISTQRFVFAADVERNWHYRGADASPSMIVSYTEKGLHHRHVYLCENVFFRHFIGKVAIDFIHRYRFRRLFFACA